MAGIGVGIHYDPQGKPFLALEVDSGMINTQIWIADKETAIHNVAEITRQLKAASHDLMQTPDKLIAVEGNHDGLLKQPGRRAVPPAARRPPQRPGRTRP